MTYNYFKSLRKFRIPIIVKRVINLFTGLFLTSCCFFVSYHTFLNGWANMSEVEKFEGVITEKGITSHHSSVSGRYRMTITDKAFYLKLQGLNQILGVSNSQENYVSLENSLYVGDTVTVFYKHSYWTEKLNVETFQIEKNDQLILDCHDFQSKERTAFIFTLVIGFVLLILTFYQDKRIKFSK